jgi:hypothetical protein
MPAVAPQMNQPPSSRGHGMAHRTGAPPRPNAEHAALDGDGSIRKASGTSNTSATSPASACSNPMHQPDHDRRAETGPGDVVGQRPSTSM